MIVVEDRTTNEVIRFLVIDAYTKLGVVQYGTDIQTFDSQRMLRYYALVENQLFDFASRYSDSFRYLPRRAYSYLSKPPLLGEISDSLMAKGETNWFSDQFMGISINKPIAIEKTVGEWHGLSDKERLSLIEKNGITAITGSTISTRAVTNGLTAKAQLYLKAIRG